MDVYIHCKKYKINIVFDFDFIFQYIYKCVNYNLYIDMRNDMLQTLHRLSMWASLLFDSFRFIYLVWL